MTAGHAALLSLAVLVTTAAQPAGRAQPTAVVSDTVTIRIHEGTALSFDLTPDGRYIVADLLGQLWEIPIAGGTARPITNAIRDTADDRQPAISPDGRWIASRSDRPQGRGIWLHSYSGATHRQLTDSALILGGDVGVPAWGPDGQRLAYVRQGRIMLIGANGGASTKIAITGMGDGFDEPAWSPDGKQLAVSGQWRGSARALLDGPPGAPIWLVDIATGTPRRLTPEAVAARAPSWSPDGKHIAYFAADSAGGFRVELQPVEGGPRTVTREAGIEPRRVRWSRDGQWLFFVAQGKFRRVPATGGESREIAFQAELTLPRSRYTRAPVRFPEPGSTVTARGFSGLALSPDGRLIAMLALGRLWLIPIDGSARAIAPVPAFAYGLVWSPDGRQVVWTALSRASQEDLWATEIATGVTRQLTALKGEEGWAAWSPDGRWLAFYHWPKSGSTAPPWADQDGGSWLRIADARLDRPISLADTRILGEIPWGELSAYASRLQWTPAGDAILAFGGPGWPVAGRECVEAMLIQPDSVRRPIKRFPCRPGHLVLGADSSLVGIERGEIVRHRPAPGGWGDPEPLGTGPALYTSFARNGTLLYVAPDGLRLRQPDGTERRLGWPVTGRIPVPPTLLIRNVRLVPLEAGADTAVHDLLIVDGKISGLSAPGSIRVTADVRIIDAEGRWAIPGLIDVHGHLGDGHATIRGALYHGVTVMREMWHPLGESAAARDAVNARAAEGARVVVSGPPVYPTPTGEPVTNDFLWIPVDSTTAERGAELLAGFGAGHVKMRYVQSWSGASDLVAAAHRHGLSVSGHCAHGLAVAAAGIDGQEHLDGQCGDWEFGVRDDIVQLYRAAGIAVTPVIDYHDEVARAARDTSRIHAPDSEPFVTPAMRLDAVSNVPPAAQLRIAKRAGRARETTRRMFEAGVRIGLGSDAHMFPGGVPRELKALVAAGLSPRDALRAATVDAAAIIGTDQVGRLAPGMLADLVLLDGDPLVDIGNVRRIWQVIQGGWIVDRDRLRTREEPGKATLR